MGQVSIEIAGRTYRMACDDGEEERLQDLGVRFDRTIAELRRSFGEIGDRRLVVMAGLLATDELSGVRARAAELERSNEALARENAELKERLARLEAGEPADAALAPTLLEMAARVDRLAHLLNDTVREDLAAAGSEAEDAAGAPDPASPA